MNRINRGEIRKGARSSVETRRAATMHCLGQVAPLSGRCAECDGKGYCPEYATLECLVCLGSGLAPTRRD